MNDVWYRRRWLDFRFGHNTYLIFLLSFSNFVLISHRLLVERIDFLQDIFSELWFFAVVFLAAYIPVGIAIGAWHRKTQLKTENEQVYLQNPFFARMFRNLVDIIEKRSSEEEIEKFRNFLMSIESKGDRPSDKSKK